MVGLVGTGRATVMAELAPLEQHVSSCIGCYPNPGQLPTALALPQRWRQRLPG
jgi:hypothetical protein